MLKSYAVCIVIALLMTSGLFGMGDIRMQNIGQTQCFDMYGSNPINLIGAQGSATVSNMANVDQSQDLKKLCSTILTQSVKGMLTQYADASNKCGTLRVMQEGSSQGFQNQLLPNIGQKGITTQGQSLTLGLQQNIMKNSGTGTAEGSQAYLTEQNGSVIGNGTILNASQTIGAIQTANVSGTYGSNAVTGNIVNVTANQSQMAN